MTHAVRVLQYRSVAFVTYVSELHAQFAKEAMACQSLDNDEILNVRWATEDPNPTSKVQEHERLQELGKVAIRERMDERIVDAMRAVRALEEGVELRDEDEADEEQDEDNEDGPPDAKRRRIEAPDSQSTAIEPETTKGSGLLSADTIEGLKYFAEIRKRQAATKPPSLPSKPNVMALADYGSDDE